jgi:hypothetical protein
MQTPDLFPIHSIFYLQFPTHHHLHNWFVRLPALNFLLIVFNNYACLRQAE